MVITVIPQWNPNYDLRRNDQYIIGIDQTRWKEVYRDEDDDD
jgi:hypothetical protein